MGDEEVHKHRGRAAGVVRRQGEGKQAGAEGILSQRSQREGGWEEPSG